MSQQISINKAVMPLVTNLMEHAARYNIDSYTLTCGAHVIDVGLLAKGSLEASRLHAEIMLGGLGSVSYGSKTIGGINLLTADVQVDQVLIACVASQIAGWKIPLGKVDVLGSGPARALAVDSEDHCFDYTSYRDMSDVAVLTLQTETSPTEALAEYCAEACGVACENLYLLVHATTSLAASVQVSARIIEQTANKMMLKNFPVESIVLAYGSCVIAPVSSDYLTSMGRINDALLYGGVCTLHVEEEDAAIIECLPQLVTASSKDYGRLFKDLFVEADEKFYNMDLDIHSPARVEIINNKTGNIFSNGVLREDLLCKSFF